MRGEIKKIILNSKTCWILYLKDPDNFQIIVYSHPDQWVQEILYLFPNLTIDGYTKESRKPSKLGPVSLKIEKDLRRIVPAKL